MLDKDVLSIDPPGVDPFARDSYGSTDRRNFCFDGVLKSDISQDEVFEQVARPLLTSFLSGINGCICCYGQTGAGKTWTVSGGETFQSRGLIQRSIEALFDEFDGDSVVMISYVEIYNEVPYDLLGENSSGGAELESFPRIVLQEGQSGSLRTKNLSMHTVESTEEATDLFLFGNMNRMVSSTVMNQASSRSHCIFTLHLESRDSDTAVVRTSKLHLVDLAGSERVWKTGLSETNLREAKHINKSLHFLEQVMHALYQKASHIPYRNSVLTSLLRDSLGGNCKTVLVANVSLDSVNFKESVATCRFIQRCGQIELRIATVNAGVEWKHVAASLKQENDRLRGCSLLGPSALPVPTVSPTDSLVLRPENGKFSFESPNDFVGEGKSVRDLLDESGSNLSLFPKEIRKRLIDAVRDEGMNYRVTCVGDLCALIQVLIAKLNQSDSDKKELKEKLKSVSDVPVISISLPDSGNTNQWKKSQPETDAC